MKKSNCKNSNFLFYLFLFFCKFLLERFQLRFETNPRISEYLLFGSFFWDWNLENCIPSPSGIFNVLYVCIHTFTLIFHQIFSYFLFVFLFGWINKCFSIVWRNFFFPVGSLNSYHFVGCLFSWNWIRRGWFWLVRVKRIFRIFWCGFTKETKNVEK